MMFPWTFNHTTMPVMSLQWKMTSSYVVRLLSSPLQKGTRCYNLSMKATKEYPNANTMPTNVFIGLASMETSNMLLKHVLHVSTIAHRNHDSHSSQPQPLNAHGNTLELTSCTLMAMSTSSSLTSTLRCPSSVRYPHTNAMLPRWYLPWRNCLLNMAYQSHSTATMAPSLPAPSLQNLLLTGTLTNPYGNGQAEAAVKIIKGLLTWSKYSGEDPYLPYLPTTVHLWMHTYINLVRCSTSMPCTQHCHSISVIPTYMLLLTVTI